MEKETGADRDHPENAHSFVFRKYFFSSFLYLTLFWRTREGRPHHDGMLVGCCGRHRTGIGFGKIACKIILLALLGQQLLAG